MKSTLLLAIALSAPMALAQNCFNSAPAGINLGNAQDFIHPAQPIGFAFPLAGTTYTDIHVSDHGLCFLSNAGVPAVPAAAPFVYTPSLANFGVGNPIIAAMWSDTIPGAGGNVYINSTATSCRIEWRNMESFGFPANVFNLAMTLFPSGNIQFDYDPLVTNNSNFGGVSDNGIVGVTSGGVTTTSVDLSAGGVVASNQVFENWITANTFDMQNNSLLLIPTNPGWTYILLGSSQCATVSSIGTGCGAPALATNAIGVPTIGNSAFGLTVDNVAAISPLAFVFFGSTAVNPGLDLTFIGMPGCFGYTSADLGSAGAPVSAGSAAFSIPIPNTPSLAGAAFSAQGIAFSLSTPLNLASGNGLLVTVGN